MDNASTPKQVKKQVSREERLRRRQMDDIAAVLSSIHGRRLLWRLLTECGVFKSVHHQSGSQVYYNAGKQDVGHFLMAEVIETDPKKFMEMQTEAKDYEHV
jgi:hypothetical protein